MACELIMNINLENLKVAETIYGKMIFPENDVVVGKSLPLYGEWSEGENIVMSQFVGPGDTVLDIGANIGTTAISLSKNVGVEGKVYAFEPQQFISQCFNANLLINNIKNVVAFSLAVSSKTRWIFINEEELASVGRYGSVSVSTDGTPVKAINLNRFPINKCSLAKIDAEGHEWSIIQGAKTFLMQHQPVVYIEAKKELEGTKKYLEWFMSNGWECYWHFAFWYRKNNRNKVSNNIFKGIGDMNVVAVPRKNGLLKNLQHITSPETTWDAESYLDFYKKNNIPII